MNEPTIYHQQSCRVVAYVPESTKTKTLAFARDLVFVHPAEYLLLAVCSEQAPVRLELAGFVLCMFGLNAFKPQPSRENVNSHRLFTTTRPLAPKGRQCSCINQWPNKIPLK